MSKAFESIKTGLNQALADAGTRTKPNSKVSQLKIVEGSGNVFRDIGVSNPDAMLAKAQLAVRIISIISERKLTLRNAAEIVGMPQPKLSNILRGQFRGVSETKLMDCLLRLGNDVQIVVKPTRKKATMGLLSVAFV